MQNAVFATILYQMMTYLTALRNRHFTLSRYMAPMLATAHKIVASLALLAAALWLPVSPALAETQRHPTRIASALVPADAPAHPALWKVQKGATIIYLFGTVHALPADVQWLNGPLSKAFDASDSLVTEIIEKSPEDMRGIVFAKAMLPQGQNLRATLPAATRIAMEKALKSNALPPAALDLYRPWYAAVAISTLPLTRSGYDPANGVDTRLSQLAQAKGLAHEALETPEYQLGLFDSLPIKLQQTYLREVAIGAPKIAGELTAMIEAWKRGNALQLARLMNAGENDPRLENVLLIGRNRHWAQWIKTRLNKPGTVFMAVGAGHLAGKGSVQDQLKKLGITATRVQ